jgi:hypothetical protein
MNVQAGEFRHVIACYTDFDGYDRSFHYYNGVKNLVVGWVSDVDEVDAENQFAFLDMVAFDRIVEMDRAQNAAFDFHHHSDIYVLVPIR